MVLWVLTFAADVWGSFFFGLLHGSSIVSSGGLYFAYYALYSIVCFVYFLKSNIRTYFGI
jgi:hypothetical protein